MNITQISDGSQNLNFEYWKNEKDFENKENMFFVV